MIRWATSRPAVIWAAGAVVLLGGAVSFTRLALATRTEVELPRLQIASAWPGASAELVEMYVTSPIESAVQGVRGVKRTSSESSEGSASLTVELEPNADVQIARLSILERMELLRPDFPPGVVAPAVSNYVPPELDEEPLLRLTISGPYTSGALLKLAQEEVQPRLSAVPGVAGIEVRGGTEAGVTVSYDPRLLRQLGILPQLLGDAIGTARVVRSLGTDRHLTSERSVALRDQPSAIDQLALLPVRGPGGRVFRLGELAAVRPDADSRGFFFRINGQPAIVMAIARLAGADAIHTAASLRTAIATLRTHLPARVDLVVTSDDSTELAKQLRDLFRRGGIAFLAVLFVIAIALHDARAVSLVMGSAALAVAGTALGLFIFEIPANMLTLAGLAMGIGILVQNGLVVAERLGTAPDTADGRASVARRIAPAVIGATLTTAVVLFPFLYLQGDARAAFVPFASAFVMALGCSVLSSLVMIPALASGHRVHETSWPRSRRLYARMLLPILRWHRLTLGTTLVALGAMTVVFVKYVPRFSWSGFGQQRTSVQAMLSFPKGSDPESLENATRDLERIAVGWEGVERVIAQGNGQDIAMMQVLFTRASEFSAFPSQLEDALIQRAALIGGIAVNVRGQGPGFSSGIGSVSMSTYSIRSFGYSFDGVGDVAADLKKRLERIPRVREVSVTSSQMFGREQGYEVTLSPDRAALAEHGVLASEFARAVAREVRGPTGRQMLEIGGEEIPVTIKTVGSRERSLDELREALVPTPSGSSVRLGALAAVDERTSLGSISRVDQQYLRRVSYDFRGPAKLAKRTHDAFMKSITVPAGYKVDDVGFGFFEKDESQKGLWLVFAIGIVLVVLAVAIVFDSVWAAIIVLLSLPVALGGVMAAFWIAKVAFSREAAVGVILVVGLAVNQSILLVDAALERRRSNQQASRPAALSRRQALACALDRSGMIVLVTLTSLASLIPLAVGVDSTSLFGAIALATAGGTIAGTLGAMLVVPAIVVRSARIE